MTSGSPSSTTTRTIRAFLLTSFFSLSPSPFFFCSCQEHCSHEPACSLPYDMIVIYRCDFARTHTHTPHTQPLSPIVPRSLDLIATCLASPQYNNVISGGLRVGLGPTLVGRTPSPNTERWAPTQLTTNPPVPGLCVPLVVMMMKLLIAGSSRLNLLSPQQLHLTWNAITHLAESYTGRYFRA